MRNYICTFTFHIVCLVDLYFISQSSLVPKILKNHIKENNIEDLNSLFLVPNFSSHPVYSLDFNYTDCIAINNKLINEGNNPDTNKDIPNDYSFTYEIIEDDNHYLFNLKTKHNFHFNLNLKNCQKYPPQKIFSFAKSNENFPDILNNTILLSEIVNYTSSNNYSFKSIRLLNPDIPSTITEEDFLSGVTATRKFNAFIVLKPPIHPYSSFNIYHKDNSHSIKNYNSKKRSYRDRNKYNKNRYYQSDGNKHYDNYNYKKKYR